MEKRRLLVSMAHPDDESFGLGGVIARCVDDGVDVYLLCATNGDVGTIPPEFMNGYKSKAELRLAELDCAATTLGLKQVFKLGYKDSGMMHDATNDDPDCLWYHWRQQPQDVTQRVVAVIREVKPHVILTFDRYGSYGHPDHIAIQRATTEAFSLAGDADYIADGHPPYRPQKLYYHSIPKVMIRIAVMTMRLLGKNPRHYGRNQDIDLQAILDHKEPVHTRINIREYHRAWDEASACHASQGGGVSTRAPIWLRKRLSPTQNFRRVVPVPAQDRIDEVDLFANVDVDARVTEP